MDDNDDITEKQQELQDEREFELLQLLNFCGCGMPDDAFDYTYTYLTAIKERWQKGPDYLKLLVPQLSEGELYFFLYWADANDIIEHGGSVGGGWLTEKGKDVLEKLKFFLDQD